MGAHRDIVTALGAGAGWALLNWAAVTKVGSDSWDWLLVSQTYSGVWSNDSEGWIETPDWAAGPKEKVVLGMRMRNGEASGDIHSALLCEKRPWNYVMLEGHRKWPFGEVRLAAWDYIAGEKTYFAEFSAKVDRSSGLLELTTLRQRGGLFSDKVRLFKVSDNGTTVSEGLDIGTHCDQVLKQLGSILQHAPAPKWH